jgi:5-methylcytosine-specific restriction endonuclease McrA
MPLDQKSRVVRHKARYLKFFGYVEGDWIPCENCHTTAEEFHHVQPRSKLGSDEPSNIMALCRRCHEKAHNSNREFNEQLKAKHQIRYEAWKNCTGKM